MYSHECRHDNSIDIRTSSLKVPALVKSFVLDSVKMTKSINRNDDHNESQRQHLEENDIIFLHLDNKTY